MPQPAVVVSIHHSPTFDETKRGSALLEAKHRALQSLFAEIAASGGRASVKAALDQFNEAGWRCESYWKNRCLRLERELRAALTGADAGTRASALRAMYGRAGAARDPQVYTPTERDLVTRYRSYDDATRQMVRTLLARLAQSDEGEVVNG